MVFKEDIDEDEINHYLGCKRICSFFMCSRNNFMIYHCNIVVLKI